jgi:hypothetical protein
MLMLCSNVCCTARVVAEQSQRTDRTTHRFVDRLSNFVVVQNKQTNNARAATKAKLAAAPTAPPPTTINALNAASAKALADDPNVVARADQWKARLARLSTRLCLSCSHESHFLSRCCSEFDSFDGGVPDVAAQCGCVGRRARRYDDLYRQLIIKRIDWLCFLKSSFCQARRWRAIRSI